MEKVGIIILNYNGAKNTIECVRSLKFVKYPHIVIVVDNHSTDDSYKTLTSELSKDVIFVSTSRNLGYAGGNNVGIKKAIELGCDYICILNNDTEADSDFLAPCIEKLKNNSIAFIGPTIVDYYSGKIQSQGANINIYTGKDQLINNEKNYPSGDSFVECDYVGGACIICTKECIERQGFIPECYFLFFEETEWCYRAKKQGYKIISLGTAHIRHKGSVSIKKIKGLNNYLLYRNKCAFIRRNAENKILAFFTYKGLCFKEYVKYIMRHDKFYLDNARALKDGWKNKFNYEMYPFIVVKDD